MHFPKITHEGFALKHGDRYDMIRCYAPYILKLSDGSYILYYTGTAKCSEGHTHYRILAATSKDGIAFEKTNTPVLDFHSGAKKTYSCTVIENSDHTFVMFYGLTFGDGYKIYMTTSNNPLLFTEQGTLVVDHDQKLFRAHVYNMRFVKKGTTIHSYITGSHNPSKTKSQTNDELFSSDFRILYGTSTDGKKFSDFRKINIDESGLINMYGHDIIEIGRTKILIFSGFDGNESKLYISHSKDFVNFSKPQLLFQIDSARGEISAYSTSIVEIASKTFRLFYGSKILGAYQGVKSCLLEF